MNIKPIKTKKGTEKGDELEILGMLIENYENEKFPIGFPDIGKKNSK